MADKDILQSVYPHIGGQENISRTIPRENILYVMLKDAGADYLFKELPGSGSTPLAFETVFDQALHADLWLMKYNRDQEMNYADLQAEYTPYSQFEAFKQRHIFTCNTGKVPYYEEFPLHPDYLLQDFVWIFHPELLPDYTPRYYQPMVE